MTAQPKRAQARAWASTWGLLLAALMVAAVLGRYLPSLSTSADRPFVHTASIGQDVPLRTLTVRVNKVSTATSITDGFSTLTTNDVFLIVSVTFTPTTRTTLPMGVELHAPDGTIFGGRQVVSSTCRASQPGLPQSCLLPFEVPPDAAPGLRLWLPSEPFADPAGDDVASIDLGITDLDALTAAPPGVTLPPARFP